MISTVVTGKRAFRRDINVAANKQTFSGDICVSQLKVLKDNWRAISTSVIQKLITKLILKDL